MRTALYHQDNAANRRVLRSCPTLQGFAPRPWLRNPHAQIAALLSHERAAPPVRWDRIERLTMSDGGVVSLQWLGAEDPARRPIVMLLTTIMGEGDDLGDLVRHLRAALGWTVVVCNRRGHAGVPLATPRFNTVGEVGDLRAQIEHIRVERPQAPLFAIGVSAGSGLLARYLGETPETPIRAAGMHCPGYDLEDLFDHAHPVYSRLMAKRLKRHFLRDNADMLADHPDYRACAASRDLAEFHRRAHGLAGFATRAEYLRASNPMVVAHDIRTPLLVLNAVDDPICSIRIVDRVRRSLIAAVPHGILAVTRYGSHCSHIYGVRPRTSWAHAVLAEYLAAQHRGG